MALFPLPSFPVPFLRREDQVEQWKVWKLCGVKRTMGVISCCTWSERNCFSEQPHGGDLINLSGSSCSWSPWLSLIVSGAKKNTSLVWSSLFRLSTLDELIHTQQSPPLSLGCQFEWGCLHRIKQIPTFCHCFLSQLLSCLYFWSNMLNSLMIQRSSTVTAGCLLK